MRCDHACAHCGSRAVQPRENELTREEVFDVADQLARLGTREVTLIGGEAYLYPGIEAVVAHLTHHGIRVGMQTGGRGFNPMRAKALAKAGLKAVGFSVDGTAETHDVLRDSPGSHAAALQGMANAKAAGMAVTANSQVNRLNRHVLAETAALLKNAGARVWRCQLTVPMGRAADRPDWILEPYMVLDVIDTLADIQVQYAEQAIAAGLPPKRIFNILMGNNLGYYGPHEVLLRSHPGQTVMQWKGCNAGVYQLGIESDGKVKACPSLPTAPYVGGNVRDLSIEQIFNETPELAFARDRTTDEMWGFCRSCEYAEVCRGGCSFTAHCTMGKRGNNPFCYHRADTLRSQGRRERLVQAERAEGIPYDFGRFEIVEEEWVELGS
ncbi:MAG: radical SAM protein [Proteobacteria bacterium]|nr:radical SAM protein [Pseudomonadota bacterium]